MTKVHAPRFYRSVLLGTLALTLGAGAAFGQVVNSGTGATLSTIPVQAHRMVRHKIIGRDYAGVPIEELQLTREVGYGDLNLKTTKGADELLNRINYTAREACHQLSSLYPLAMWAANSTNHGCVDQAEKMARAQLPASVAQLQRERAGTLE